MALEIYNKNCCTWALGVDGNLCSDFFSIFEIN
jgi:hypothetical protein